MVTPIIATNKVRNRDIEALNFIRLLLGIFGVCLIVV